MEWRVINLGNIPVSGILSANDAMFEGVRDKLSHPSIFISRMRPSAVTIGTFQSAQMEVNVARCKELGIDLVRRQSAGGAVFHDSHGEVQYGVIAPDELFPKELIDGYKLVCGWVIEGLLGLGIEAKFAPINDIVVNGRKISGSSQVRRDGVFMQHGTVLYKPDFKTMFEVLNVSKEKISDKNISSPQERVAGVSDFADVSIEDLASALVKGLTKGKDFKFAEKLTREESLRAMNISSSLYSSDSWNFKR